MKISFNWLKSHLSGTISPEQIEAILPSIGHEVDAVEQFGLPPFENIVVGEILESEKHPEADRLSVCKVRVSESGEPLQIVCGAKNYKVGDRVPVATVGAVLPGDFKIKKSKLRGVESCGMMCSARELGMGEDHAGLLILENRPAIGTPINEVFTDNDVIFDVALTANRGDCMSHIGLARDIAAGLNLQLVEEQAPELVKFEDKLSSEDLLKKIEVTSDACPYYTISYIKGVTVVPSPDWLKKALESVGLRSINNVVDITNWVMLETGQPLHAFDLQKVNDGEIIVRKAKVGEKITTLDEKERVLTPEMTVISDSKKALVIAGVMGSLDAEVDDNTKDIILEAAYFAPGAIRKTARTLGLSTDSSSRFSRDVNSDNTIVAANLALSLIQKVAGGEIVKKGTVVGESPRKAHTIKVTASYIKGVCGFDVDNQGITKIFKNLGFKVEGDTENWTVTVPAYRSEVTRPIDLVEEFIRVYGTDKIPAAEVLVTGLPRKDDPIATFNHVAGDYLRGQHFDECYHYSLRDHKEIELLYSKELANHCKLENPLTSDYTHLRPTLLTGLWDAFLLNQNRGNSPERLFELGRVFREIRGEIYELVAASFIFTKDSIARKWLNRSDNDFYKAKSIALQLAELAGISCCHKEISVINEDVLWQGGHSAVIGDLETDGFEIRCGLANLNTLKGRDIESMLLCGELVILPEHLKKHPEHNQYKPFSLFPGSTKDIALIVDKERPAKEIRQLVRKIAQESTESFDCENVEIFDVYEGKGISEGKKSLGLALKFRAMDRTLTDDEIMSTFNLILEKIRAMGGLEIRG